MNRLSFQLASPEDDADLRHILAATPMEGGIAVSFRREPSWFDAAVIDGFFRQVVVGRDGQTGRIFGFGCRSLRELYVNGEPMIVGYLSSLRALPEYRNRGLLARGYAFFRKLNEDGRTPFYLTTIAEGNDTALRILTSGRAGLPTYHPAGCFHTVALALPRRKRAARQAVGPAIRCATIADLPAIIDFLNTVGRRRQFFPIYRREDFLAHAGLLRGLDLKDVLLAERGARMIGMLAAWDQHAYRQHVVHGYAGWLKVLRPLYNLAARAGGYAGLPAPGEPLRVLLAALLLIADDDPAVLEALVTTLRSRFSGGEWTHLLVGLHESDPLLTTIRQFQATCYSSFLFLVCWPEGNAARLSVDDRPIYLELGSL